MSFVERNFVDYALQQQWIRAARGVTHDLQNDKLSCGAGGAQDWAVEQRLVDTSAPSSAQLGECAQIASRHKRYRFLVEFGLPQGCPSHPIGLVVRTKAAKQVEDGGVEETFVGQHSLFEQLRQSVLGWARLKQKCCQVLLIWQPV